MDPRSAVTLAPRRVARRQVGDIRVVSGQLSDRVLDTRGR